MKRILVDMTVVPEAVRQLEARGDVELRFVEPAYDLRELPVEQIRDINYLFCTFAPSNVAEMKELEWIQISSVGFSQLYNLGLAECGFPVTNARGVFDITIAEWNITMMDNLLRDVRGMIRNQEHGIWDRPARFQRELRGLACGIWGYGGIGRATARLAKAFDLKLHVFARSGVGPRDDIYLVPGTGDSEGILPDKVFTKGQELEFLSGLDFLVLSVPQTPQTTGMIGERELQALPNTAYVLNPARGPLIQEEALLKALRQEWIAGAALDTHYYYPMPADHPLWRFPNVIMTPHISGSDLSPHYMTRIWDIFARNLERQISGRPLLNTLSPGDLKGE